MGHVGPPMITCSSVHECIYDIRQMLIGEHFTFACCTGIGSLVLTHMYILSMLDPSAWKERMIGQASEE